jgi:hypothetical protein
VKVKALFCCRQTVRPLAPGYGTDIDPYSLKTCRSYRRMGASTYSTWLIERLGRSTDCSVVGNLVYTRLIFNNLINYIPLLIRDLLNIKSFDHFIKILKTLKLYNLYILNFISIELIKRYIISFYI